MILRNNLEHSWNWCRTWFIFPKIKTLTSYPTRPTAHENKAAFLCPMKSQKHVIYVWDLNKIIHDIFRWLFKKFHILKLWYWKFLLWAEISNSLGCVAWLCFLFLLNLFFSTKQSLNIKISHSEELKFQIFILKHPSTY